MKQTWLILRVIEAVVLNGGMNRGKYTPAEASPLVKDEDGELTSGELTSGKFNYSSVVGMILYLNGHTRPDIAYAVN